MKGLEGEVRFIDHAVKNCVTRGLNPERILELLKDPHFQQRSDAALTSAAYSGQVRMEHFLFDGDLMTKVITVPAKDHYLIITVIAVRKQEENGVA